MLLAALAALFSTHHAEAAQRACHGAATGAAGDVRVVLIVDDGKVTAGLWRWIPKPDPASTFGARIVVERRYLDLENGVLGPVQVVQAANVARLDPPQLEQAIVSVATEAAGPVTKEWRMYGQAAATIKAGGKPSGMPAEGPANFVGIIAFGAQEPGVAQLLASLNGGARLVTTQVADPKGLSVISRGRFDLSARAIAEATGREARRLASAAAVRPEQACEPLAAAPAGQAAGQAANPSPPG